MKNDTNRTLVINGKTKLSRVMEYEADKCYRAHINAVSPAPADPQCSTICDLLAYHSQSSPGKLALKNGITIYRNLGTLNKIAQIAQKFEPSL